MEVIVTLTNCTEKAKNLRRFVSFLNKNKNGGIVAVSGIKLVKGDQFMFTETREIFEVKSVCPGYVEFVHMDTDSGSIEYQDNVLYSDGIVCQKFCSGKAHVINSDMSEWEYIEEGNFDECE